MCLELDGKISKYYKIYSSHVSYNLTAKFKTT